MVFIYLSIICTKIFFLVFFFNRRALPISNDLLELADYCRAPV